MQNRNKARGTANENALVQNLRGSGFKSARRVPLSGAGKDYKGDVEVPEASTLIEAKVYQTGVNVAGEKYIRFDLGWVDKAEKEAQQMGFTHSAVVVRGKGCTHRFAVLSWDEYQKYLEYCKASRH